MLLVSFEVGASRGEFEVVTDEVRALTGQAPTSVRAFLAAARDGGWPGSAVPA